VGGHGSSCFPGPWLCRPAGPGCESRITGRALGDPSCLKVIIVLGDRIECPCYGHVQSQLQNIGKTAHVTEYRLFSLWSWSTAIRSAKNMTARFANTNHGDDERDLSIDYSPW
jgi:hypothetical protein